MASTQQKSNVSTVLLRILFTGLLIATFVFIFFNSSELGSLSGLRSARVTEWLNAVLARLGIGVVLSEQAVRKLAHFGEFALLGFFMMLTLRVYTRRIVAFVAWPLLIGLSTAVADELFQLYVPGRSSSVVDVVLDFVGVLGGLGVAFVILLLAHAVGSLFRK